MSPPSTVPPIHAPQRGQALTSVTASGSSDIQDHEQGRPRPCCCHQRDPGNVPKRKTVKYTKFTGSKERTPSLIEWTDPLESRTAVRSMKYFSSQSRATLQATAVQEATAVCVCCVRCHVHFEVEHRR